MAATHKRPHLTTAIQCDHQIPMKNHSTKRFTTNFSVFVDTRIEFPKRLYICEMGGGEHGNGPLSSSWIVCFVLNAQHRTLYLYEDRLLQQSSFHFYNPIVFVCFFLERILHRFQCDISFCEVFS